MAETLEWYGNHLAENPWIPEAFSAETFCTKYARIRAARHRYEQEFGFDGVDPHSTLIEPPPPRTVVRVTAEEFELGRISSEFGLDVPSLKAVTAAMGIDPTAMEPFSDEFNAVDLVRNSMGGSEFFRRAQAGFPMDVGELELYRTFGLTTAEIQAMFRTTGCETHAALLQRLAGKSPKQAKADARDALEDVTRLNALIRAGLNQETVDELLVKTALSIKELWQRCNDMKTEEFREFVRSNERCI